MTDQQKIPDFRIATGARIRDLRKKKGISQVKLSELLEVGVSTVSKYESGAIALSVDQAFKLAELFDVTTDYILALDVLHTGKDKRKEAARIMREIKRVIDTLEDSEDVSEKWLNHLRGAAAALNKIRTS